MQPLAEPMLTRPGRRRRRITALLPLIVGALLGMSVFSACVEPGDNCEIVSGTSPTEGLIEELTRLGVTLPSDTSQVSWLMINTWDTNDTFVRLTTSRSGLVHLLDQSNVEDRALMPLAKADDWDRVLPQQTLSGIPTQVARPTDIDVWSLRDAEKNSAVAYPMDNDLPSVGAIVLNPAGTRPTIILHWNR